MATNNSHPETEAKAEEGHKKKIKPGKPTSMGQPPLTPLIDVFLFLIIFFLLSCQFHQAEGTIPANLPRNLAGGTGEAKVLPDPIIILLAPNGRDSVEIKYGPKDREKLVDGMVNLFNGLQELRVGYGAAAAEIPIAIKPSPGVRWGSVVDAFNQAVRAGFKEVGLGSSGGR